MKCNELLNTYNFKTKNKELSDEDRIKIISEIIHPRKYLSFKKKQEIVLDILSEVIKIEEGKLKYNSCEKYYKFITTLLSTYTDLELLDDGYDTLCSNNLLNYTIATLGSEYDLCLGIMEMYMDDLQHNRIMLEKS